MKYNRIISGAAVILLMSALANSGAFSAEPASELLDVTKFDIHDENLSGIGASHLNDVSVLFDQQDKVPASPSNTKVDKEIWNATVKNKNWKPNQQSEYGDDSFYIDMGANYIITGICYLDTNGVNSWKIECGEPFSWNELYTFKTDTYNSWQGRTIDNCSPTRYLRFSTGCGDSGISELAIYGYKVSELSDEQIIKTAPKASDAPKDELTAGGIVGFNAFIDDPFTSICAGGNVREYHNLSWLIGDDGKVKFTQGTWGDMDAYYGRMNELGISIIPCFQGSCKYIYGEEKYPETAVKKGADTSDPLNYSVHAQAMYQVAARYGSRKDIPKETLNVDDSSEPVCGLGLLTALENSNEPNKGWAGKANYYTPYELAAMCSADYDGHEGKIPCAGVKTADPDFKLAMGGLVGTASMLDYLTEMKLWFDYNRSDGKFAVDIINVHMGPDDVIPEKSNFPERIAAVQEWIDKNAPGTELWISEFEIPMSDCEIEGVDDHDNEKYQLRYAQRTARTYLTAIGKGVDRVSKFQLRDEGSGVYYNSGLVTQKGKWDKKLAWYYVSCMSNVLKNADLVEDISTSEVSVYRFKDRVTGDIIDCVWSPTSEDKVVKNFSIKTDRAHAYLTVPSEYMEGTVSELTIKNNAVSLDVTETPVYITYADHPKSIVNGKGKYIQPVSICLNEDGSGEVCDLSAAPKDSSLGQFYRMFDEPDTMPTFIYGDTSGLSKPETNVNKSGITCYAELGGAYILDGFGVYDTYGTGSIEVYDGDSDTLLWSSDLGAYMSRSLDIISDTAPVRRLKIVKKGGDLNELAIYGYKAADSVIGDVNRDGAFNTADLVLLSRYLLGSTNDLPDADAGDLCKDGRLDAYDLVIMRKALTK